MNSEHEMTDKAKENPFADMGMIKFWIVSSLFWITFPISLTICFLTMGVIRTKQLVKALFYDFVQTILFIFLAFLIIVWAIYHFVSGLL